MLRKTRKNEEKHLLKLIQMKDTLFRISTATLVLLLSLLITSCNHPGNDPVSQQEQDTSYLPFIQETNGVKQLIVDGAPFTILGGELLNSSASSIEHMEPVWSRVKSFNVNTILLPINWQQFEPVEGEFDYSLIDNHIKKAHEHGLRMIVLWFGSWKNGRSNYTPDWVKKDLERFPRMRFEDQRITPTLSNMSENCLEADKRAYLKLLERIAEVDRHHTVIMMQIENEVGLLGDSRDFSPAANTLFGQQVPAKLVDHLRKNIDHIKPFIREAYQNNGSKTEGSWTEIFGESMLTDEMFMAWNYATYINEISKAGKAVHNLPTFVNAWSVLENKIPGDWPSGGPNYRMLDVWQAGAPDIDILAIDNYHLGEKFDDKCRDFVHMGNPLFIPEACAIFYDDTISAAAKAFYTIGHFDAMCFSPFGIDHDNYHDNHPVKNAYKALTDLMPLINKAQVENKIEAFMEFEDTPPSSFTLGGYNFVPDYGYFNKAPHITGFGMIIQTGEDEFIVAGNGFKLSFSSACESQPNAQLLSVEEGTFVDGDWKTGRMFNGDEFNLKLPAKPYSHLPGNVVLGEISIHKIKLFKFQ